MHLNVIIGVVALAVCVGCAVAASITQAAIADKLHAALPKDSRFDALRWQWKNGARLRAEYQRFYPTGQLVRRFWILVTISFAFLLIEAWALGEFSHWKLS